jgi:uracil-DNA glycosylase
MTRSFQPIALPESWENYLGPTANEYLGKALTHLRQALENEKKVYPPPHQILRALDRVQPRDVRVVILGQDPYHQAGQANGLAFAVDSHVKPPPSLQNIRKAIEFDASMCRSEGQEACLSVPIPWHSGDPEQWVEHGVLMLNDVLTVEEGKPGSHKGWGWSNLTSEIIRAMHNSSNRIVWMLWGKDAQNHWSGTVNPHRVPSNHLILDAPHPSPLSAYRGFFGCRHFSKANQFLNSYL